MKSIGKKSKIRVDWKVSPYDYSLEKEKEIKLKISKKYGIPINKINVLVKKTINGENADKLYINNEVITNIQNPKFQLSLFKKYLDINNFKDYDFNIIEDIDKRINCDIDYEVYDKYKRYSIKWIKWDNFLSYGNDNFFDFTKLNGLVLLSGEPANQSGKTTFAIDLLHFLLFGESNKVPTLIKAFNSHLPNTTEVNVEGCLIIEGEEYIIKRRITRPELSKRTNKSTAKQKVEYYKVINGIETELEEYIEDKKGEHSIQTNKIIKDAIGKKEDFNLIISATNSNLDDLIEKGAADRGRLFARWIGLLPLEQKDMLAKKMYDETVKPYLISNHYDIETLKSEIETLTLTNQELNEIKENTEKENEEINKEIEKLEEKKDKLLESKLHIKEDLINVDITTLEKQINNKTSQISVKKEQSYSIATELNNLGCVEFSKDDYEKILNQSNEYNNTLGEIKANYNFLKKQIQDLQENECCPTCGRKYENIDNTEKIATIKQEMSSLKNRGINIKEKYDALGQQIQEYNRKREESEKISKLTIQKSQLESESNRLQSELDKLNQIYDEYQKNSQAIDKNNQIDIDINLVKSDLKNKKNTENTNKNTISNLILQISINDKKIKENKDLIEKLKKEYINIRHWEMYRKMVGKDGISKMVLRDTLPIINTNLACILNDVCDFKVEVGINEKNEVNLYLIKDNVKSDLKICGSGFEKTAAALALRSVLGNMSILPKCNYMVVDEVLGRVAKENYENMRKLYEKILKDNYDAIIQISHLSEIKEWHDQHIVVTKENNISKIHLI